MRIAIVDDAAEDLKALEAGVRRWAEEKGIPLIPPPALFENGEALLDDFARDTYDVIFLDIFMDGIGGMEVARRIRETDSVCRLVFTTASPEFAVESYEVDSSYYLVKPFGSEKLAAALDRCGAAFLERMQSIAVPDGERLLLHQIAYTEFVSRKVLVHFKDGGQRAINMKQSDFSVLLLQYPYFCDCMKGILVNFEAVEKLTEDSFLLYGGQRAPISRLKYRAVREQFLDYTYTLARGGS